MLAQTEESQRTPFAWHVARFDKQSGKLVQHNTHYTPVAPEIMKNLRHTFDIVVTELDTRVQP